MSEWISVKDRLPEPGKVQFVWYESNDDGEAGYGGTAFISRTWNEWTRSDGNRANGIFGYITHWMPFSEPSK